VSKSRKKYDVFLSYNSHEHEDVARIAAFLSGKKLRVFFDRSSLEAGDRWLRFIQEVIPACKTVVVFQGREEFGPWQKEEIDLALLCEKKKRGFRVIPVLLPGADPALSFLEVRNWIDLRAGLEDVTLLEGLASALAPKRVEPLAEDEPHPAQGEISPYRDLQPYREEDALAFFGQQELVKRLEALVRVQSFTALMGPSGCGKTSLVQAGLLPRLRAEGESKQREWVFVTVWPGGDPLSRLCSALASWLSQDQSRQAELALQWERDIRTGATGLSQLVLIVLDVLRARRLLLVLDAGEDLWAPIYLGNSQFLQEITALVPVAVLLILRADDYGRALEHPILGRLLPGRAVRMAPMSSDLLKRTISDLATKGRLSFRPARVAELVNELEHAPSSLSLLQRVLTEIWHRRDKDSEEAYAGVGLLRGVATTLAEGELPDSPVDQEMARRLFLRLVSLAEDGTASTRRRIFWEEVEPAFGPLVESLVKKRILVVGWDEQERKPSLELGYDELVQWVLQRWITDEPDERPFLLWRQVLRWKRRDWEHKSHTSDLLLDDQSLVEARAWRETRAGDLVAIEKLYIRNSEVEYQRRIELEAWRQAQREREEERRKQRRRRSQLTATVLLLTFIGVLSGIWYATRKAAHERSMVLAAEASRLADRKLDLALLLALQAGQISPTADARGVTLSLTAGNPALKNFLQSEMHSGKAGTLEKAQPGEILATAFGPGDVVATGGNGTVFLWDAKQGTLRNVLDAGAPAQIVSLAFSPDGTVLASGSVTAGFIHLWRLQSSQALTELDPIRTDGSTQNLTFGPGGRLLAWSTPSGAYVWDLARGVLVRHFPRAPVLKSNWVSGLAFAPSGVLALATADGRISFWEQGMANPLWSKSEAGLVLGLAFPSGKGALYSAGSSFRRWNLTAGQPIGEPCNLLVGPGDEVTSVAFSRDWRFVASGHLDRKIRLWDVSHQEGCRLVVTLSGHSGFIWSLSFGSERPGNRLALISGGQWSDLVLWEADPSNPTLSIPLARPAPKGMAILAVSQDGSLIAVGDTAGRLTLFDGKNRTQLGGRQSRNQRAIDRMAFSPDGKVLATSGPEGTVLLWNVQQRQLRLRDLLTVRGQAVEGDSVQSLSFSRDSVRVAVVTKAGRLIVWQPDVTNTPAWSTSDQERIVSVTFVSEKRSLMRRQNEYIVTGSVHGNLSLWDPANGKRIQTVEFAHSQSIKDLAARADGLLASGSRDRNARLWRIGHGLEPQGTLFLGSMIADLALSPQGELLAAAVGEGGLRNEIVLWDLKAGIPLGGGFQAPEEIGSVDFDPSGRFLYMAGKGTTAWWDLRPQTWSSRACDMVRRSLSPVEREGYLKPSEKPVDCFPHMQRAE